MHSKISALKRLRKEDQKFQASLDYVARPYLKHMERRKEGKEGGREGGREGGTTGWILRLGWA
jgi:hypothetical protein